MARLFQLLQSSIRNKLIVALLLVSLVPLLALGLIAQERAASSLSERAVSQLESVEQLQKARLVKQHEEYANVVKALADDPDLIARVDQLAALANRAKDTDQKLYDEYVRVMEEIGSNPELIDRVKKLNSLGGLGAEPALAKVREELAGQLHHRIRKVPFIINAFIVNPKGKVIADTLPKQKNQTGQDQSNDSEFTGAKATPGLVFFKSLHGSSSGALAVSHSITLKDEDNLFVGVAVIRLDFLGLAKRFREEVETRMKVAIRNIPAVENALLCDTQGVVVADTAVGARRSFGKDFARDASFTGAMQSHGKLFRKPLYQARAGQVGSALSVNLRDSRNRNLGVLVLRFSTQELDRILAERTGLGSTGESYLVARPDGEPVLGTASRFTPDGQLKVKVDTEAVRNAFAGQTGASVYNTYRGTAVLGAYSYMPEYDAVLVSELQSSEAFSAVTTLRLVVLLTFLVVFGLVLVVAIRLSGGLTKQVRNIQELFQHIGVGNFQARAKVTSKDELGAMAASLNAMLDNTLTLIQSREERDQIQASISKLLEEVSGVAEGDLSKTAEVTADMTGAIADAFNYMIDQLRKIIGNVQAATTQVASSAVQLQTTAEQLAHGSENQAEQIVSTSAAIDEMAVSIQQVSGNAQVAADVAREALSNAVKGNEAVSNTIQGMNRIRDQVQETAKRIKRLGESSQEIGQIIQLIDDIADRTSILALNASIQAAAAGEAGRGFAVVAAEVERLAERSTEATKKIATLIKTIQSETGEAVAAMEKGINEVVDGSRLTNQAGQSLEQIQSVSNRLAELIQSISLAASQQARGSESLAKSMGEISNITRQSAQGTKQAAESVSQLTVLADGLRESVSTFLLPETDGHPKSNGNLSGNGHGNGNGNGHGPAPRMINLAGKN
jgi:methyl-accepting chemotaxis protein